MVRTYNLLTFQMWVSSNSPTIELIPHYNASEEYWSTEHSSERKRNVQSIWRPQEVDRHAVLYEIIFVEVVMCVLYRLAYQDALCGQDMSSSHCNDFPQLHFAQAIADEFLKLYRTPAEHPEDGCCLEFGNRIMGRLAGVQGQEVTCS